MKYNKRNFNHCEQTELGEHDQRQEYATKADLQREMHNIKQELVQMMQQEMRNVNQKLDAMLSGNT